MRDEAAAEAEEELSIPLIVDEASCLRLIGWSKAEGTRANGAEWGGSA